MMMMMMLAPAIWRRNVYALQYGYYDIVHFLFGCCCRIPFINLKHSKSKPHTHTHTYMHGETLMQTVPIAKYPSCSFKFYISWSRFALIFGWSSLELPLSGKQNHFSFKTNWVFGFLSIVGRCCSLYVVFKVLTDFLFSPS